MRTHASKSTLQARVKSVSRTLARCAGARFQALAKYGGSLWMLTVPCTNSMCETAGNLSGAALSVETVIYDYKPLVHDQAVRRREAGLSDAEKQDAASAGSTMRGTARGVARGTARGVARGTARGVANGVAAGGIVTGVAENSFRSIVGSSVRNEIRQAEGNTETPTESVYAHFEDTLYLLPDRIEPIAPQGIGYSAAAQPNLYFYMNAPSSRPIEFNLLRQDALDPVAVSHILVNPESKVIDPGIHSISLEALEVVLEAGIEYEWSITIVVDLVERSGDIVANGIVMHQQNPEIQKTLSDLHLPEHGVYSINGYWYDAVDSLMLLKQTDEPASFVNQQLLHWLTQEKLPSTAAFVSNGLLPTD